MFVDLLPDFIEVETSTKCNRACPWCPNSKYPRGSSQEVIDPGLFQKIILDLKKAGYNEKLALHNYNEPLLDPFLLRHIEVAKKELPESQLLILTNGDFLNKEWLRTLENRGISFLRISMHDAMISKNPEKTALEYMKRLGFTEPFEDVSDEFGVKRQTMFKKMTVMYFIPTKNRLTTRGGIIQELGGFNDKRKCYLPFVSCAIDYEGNMKICCEVYPSNEIHERHGIIGNISDGTFLDLWLSAPFNRLRKEIIKGTVDNPICLQCPYKVRPAYTIEDKKLMKWQSFLRI